MANDVVANSFGKSYHSFSGVDIKAVFGSKVLTEIQAISYSVTREKAPLYTMGSADPRSFSRGKRGIAGTLIFLMFDKHALLGTFGIIARQNNQDHLWFMADTDDFVPNTNVDNSASTLSLYQLGALAEGGTGESVDFDSYVAESDLSGGIDSDQEPWAPWFSDQIPPFDVTLAAANEYGSFAVMRIFGVEILNEGYGVSIDDITSEMQNTYVARTLTPWQRVTSPETMAKTAKLYE